jgi:hypothetical protein
LHRCGQPRENCSLAAVIPVARRIDQLPGDAASVEVLDHRRRRRLDELAVEPEGDAFHGRDDAAAGESPHEPAARELSLAAHDDVDLRLRGEDLPIVIRGEDAAVDDHDVRQQGADATRQLHRDRVRGGRARMSEHQHLRPVGDDPGDHRLVGERTELRVEQAYVMTGVDQRPADRQQSERRQLLARDAAAYGDMRRIEEKDAHTMTLRILCGRGWTGSWRPRARWWLVAGARQTVALKLHSAGKSRLRLEDHS